MAIKGSLNEASLPDIIQLLSIGQKTGVLSITNRQNFGNIYLKDGDVIFANIVNREDRIGDILIRRNRITQEALNSAIKKQERANGQKMLGKILVEMELITEQELIEHLQIQIEEAIYTLLTWRDGFFVFEPNRLPDENMPAVRIRTSKLVMEAARRIDEWEVMRKKIRSLQMVVKLTEGRQKLDQKVIEELNCSDEEWKILSTVDNKRTIQDISDITSINEFDVAKVIYGMISSGLLEVHEEEEQPEPVQPNDNRIEETHNLGLAFYKAELYEEARKEYEKVLKMQPQDPVATYYLASIAFQQSDFEKSIELYKRLMDTPNPPSNTFNNLAQAYEQKGDLDQAIVTLEKGLEKNPHHLKMQINLGRMAAKKGDLKRARVILENAKDRDPEYPLPVFYLAQVLTKMEEYEKALALYQSLKKDDKNEVILNNEGVLLEILGKNKEAIDIYKNALKLAPNQLKSRQSLADIYYRNGWHQDALDEYQRVIEINPSSSEAYFKIGNIHMKYQEREKALASWEKSLELDNNNELLRRNIETVKKLKLMS